MKSDSDQVQKNFRCDSFVYQNMNLPGVLSIKY